MSPDNSRCFVCCCRGAGVDRNRAACLDVVTRTISKAWFLSPVIWLQRSAISAVAFPLDACSRFRSKWRCCCSRGTFGRYKGRFPKGLINLFPPLAPLPAQGLAQVPCRWTILALNLSCTLLGTGTPTTTWWKNQGQKYRENYKQPTFSYRSLLLLNLVNY